MKRKTAKELLAGSFKELAQTKSADKITGRISPATAATHPLRSTVISRTSTISLPGTIHSTFHR